MPRHHMRCTALRVASTLVVALAPYSVIVAQTAARTAPRPASLLSDELVRFVRVEFPAVEGKRYMGWTVDTLPAGHPSAPFVRDAKLVLTYLIDNAPGLVAPREPIIAADTSAHREAFFASLRRSSATRALIDDMHARYTASRIPKRRSTDEGRSGPGAPPARYVALDDWMRIAVRFFYPDQVRPDGSISGHVCVGANGLADQRGGRDLLLEALAFSAIKGVARDGADDPRPDFIGLLQTASSLKLSESADRTLNCAQGIAWAGMMRSDRLRRTLLAEYERVRDFVPMRLMVGADAPAAGRRLEGGDPGRSDV